MEPEYQAENQVPAAVSPKRSMLPLLIIVGALIGGVIGALAGYAYQNKQNIAIKNDLQNQINGLQAQIADSSSPDSDDLAASELPESSASPTPSVSPSAAATISACQTANLAVGLSGGNGAAGTMYYTLSLTNNGSQSCTITGSPRIAALDETGTLVGQTVPAAHTATAVTVAAGGKVYSTVGFPNSGNFSAGTCTAMKSLLVYPPGQTVGLPIANIDQYNSTYTSKYCQDLRVTDFAATVQ